MTPDAYPHLTDAQYDLFDCMSEISEEAYCAAKLKRLTPP